MKKDIGNSKKMKNKGKKNEIKSIIIRGNLYCKRLHGQPLSEKKALRQKRIIKKKKKVKCLNYSSNIRLMCRKNEDLKKGSF